MAKFQFRLQNILSVKEKFEEQKRMELSNANQLLEIEERRLTQLITLRDNNNNLYKKMVSDRITVKDIRDFGEKNKYYTNVVLEQNITVTKANSRVESIRDELKEALIEKKMYEKLKENAYEEYYKEECKEEQKHLDEIVSYKYRK
ncbi:flagellar export protein FliJ [Vallitalea guaymasensis]|uniref:Flagellar FliJ protein n=1 Tax=Vallitalea guaymasensis TaxID=1185412 RepID=A0A8J8MF06_9FIRM|nr:flagellar export protein FliJ [Vallitalea guaymasensis]QUH31440.1 flagellar export protein FliJ [Vallitalea guaymasensis]